MNDKSCPFCGSDELAVEGDADGWKLICDDCRANGQSEETEEDATQLWNQRPASSSPN